MRSFVLCTLLLALAAASAQAGGVKKARRTSAVQYTCDVQGIVEQVADIVSDSIAVALNVKNDLSAISSGVLSCVSKDIVKPADMVSCVVDEAKAEAEAVYTAVQNYLADIKTAATTLETKVRQCSQL